MREDIDIFKGLEKGRGVGGEVEGGSFGEMGRGLEDLKGKRVPGIEA